MRITLLGAGTIGQTIARLLVPAATSTSPCRRQRRGTAKLATNPCAHAAETADAAALLEVLRARRSSTPCPITGHAGGDAGARGRLPLFRPHRGRGATRPSSSWPQAPHRLHAAVRLAPASSASSRTTCASFDSLQEVKMRSARCPFPTNSLKYNLTWSSRPHQRVLPPCEATAAAAISSAALEGLEHFSLDGTVRGLHTSGGLGTRARRSPAACRRWITRACATPASQA